MPATIRNVVDDAQGIVGEVAGPSVQAFSDDRMFNDAIRGFNMLFKKYNWRDYCQWLQLTLDGVLGIVTTNDLQNVQDFEDFIAIRRDGSHRNLSLMPRDVSPFQTDMLSGSTPRYWDMLYFQNANYATRRLQFYPKTAVGLVNIHAKFYPVINDAWDWQDTFHMDRDMLAYACAYATLAGDDLNAAGADMCKNMMEMRYRDIQGQLASQEIHFGARVIGVPDQWHTLP